jgi:small redox-active disulfide protein 2
MKITVFGTGCPKCQTVERHAREALEELGLAAEIEHIREPVEIARHNVLFTPGLAIDGVLKASGKVPSVDEVKGWLQR